MSATPESPRVALVVLNWNGKEDTIRCLASLDRATYQDLHVIVVDNGSSDGSRAAILKAHPEIELISLPTNEGYTGGNNAGIEHALASGAEIVGVLNNDTVVDPGFLEPIVEQIQRNHLTFVSPRIVYMDDPTSAWFVGSYLDPKVGVTYHEPVASSLAASRSGVRETVAVTGCCLVAHHSLWARVGLFDDRYFLIFEDADWCARARKAGARACVVLDSSVEHAVSASFESGRPTVADYYYIRNGLLYLKDHSRRRIRCSIYFVGRVLRGSIRGFVREPGATRARSVLAQLRGIEDFLRQRFGRRLQRGTDLGAAHS